MLQHTWLLKTFCCSVTKSCLILCNSMDCSLPGSSVHGILQARMLEWVAMPSSRGSSQSSPTSPALQEVSFWATGEARFIKYSPYYVEVFILYIHLSRVFIINGCWILSKPFSASIEMIIWFSLFNLLMWYITLIDWQILSHSCISRINPIWSWCMILYMYCWIWFANIFLRLVLLNLLRIVLWPSM